MKLNLVGIGKLSSKIVDKLGDENDVKLCYSNNFPNCSDLEQNEIYFQDNIISQIQNIDTESISETYVFVDGKQGISGITLSLLQFYKDKDITVFYIKSHCNSDIEKKNQHITINILQEYARSGMFKSIFIIDYDNIMTDIINNIPEDADIDYNNVDNFFIDKLLFCVHVYWRLCNETYIDGEKINFHDTIYRTKTFFDIGLDSIKYFYKMEYPMNHIYVKGVKSKMSKKQLVELQSFKAEVQKNEQSCVFLSADEYEFQIGIVETKIIQESSYI